MYNSHIQQVQDQCLKRFNFMLCEYWCEQTGWQNIRCLTYTELLYALWLSTVWSHLFSSVSALDKIQKIHYEAEPCQPPSIPSNWGDTLSKGPEIQSRMRFICSRFNFAQAPVKNIRTDTSWQPTFQRQLGVTTYCSVSCWSLLRNNNMAINFQTFTSSFGSRRFSACDQSSRCVVFPPRSAFLFDLGV